MPIADAIRDAVTPLAPLRASEIEARLHRAQNEQAALNVGFDELALDAEVGVAGAADRFTERQAAVRACVAKIERLEAALKGAKDNEQRERFAIQARKRVRDLKKVEETLVAREKAAERLVAGIAEATSAYRAIQELTEQACRPVPEIRARYGEAWLLGMGQLKRAVESELYRQGAHRKKPGDDPGYHPGSFPGGKPPNADLIESPQRLEPLDVAIKNATTGLMALLREARTIQ
jgi:hypothetical protein